MKSLRIVIVAFLAAAVFPACAKNSFWYGMYFYEASLGRNVAGDAVIVEYSFTFGPDECEIQVQGYQVAESIVCDAYQTDDRLAVRFKSFSNGSTKNTHGVDVYGVNALLFELEMLDKKIVTKWGELLPDESLSKSGRYFVKQTAR